MRGIGYQCDQCERKVVDAAQHFGGLERQYAPVGWIDMTIHAEDSMDHHEFCGLACASIYTALKREEQDRG